MTKSGFDLDEIERLLAAADELAADMAEIVKEWERDEPRDDWFLHQHDHADAVEMLNAQSTAIRELRAENARLRVECEFIASATASPLINPLETGFRHSPLSPRERETRYMEACALAYQSARAALGEPQ